MTIKEAVEYLRKEKECRTLDANICFSKSCDECEYCISESALTEALCVVVHYLMEFRTDDILKLIQNQGGDYAE